jgi:hypothetical protein
MKPLARLVLLLRRTNHDDKATLAVFARQRLINALTMASDWGYDNADGRSGQHGRDHHGSPI